MSAARQHFSRVAQARTTNLVTGAIALLFLGIQTGVPGATETQPSKAFNPKNPKVQAELERLRARPFEHDPRKRPLVISERASSQKDWLEKGLAGGYAASGHTNTNWDARVHAAFSAYASYARANQWDQYKPMLDAASAAMAAGCDDPMIRYLDARYRLADRGAGGG